VSVGGSAYGEYPSDRTRLGHEWPLAVTRHVEVDLIRWIWAFIDRPLERFDQVAAFWANVTDSRLSTRRGSDAEFVTLLPPSRHPSLKLQGAHGPGGAHLDLEVNDVPAAIDVARGVGATVVAPHPDWAVMRSPGRQLFCLTPWEGAAARAPMVEHPDGTSSRLDQVCLDVAPAGYEVEKSFWTALTGGNSMRVRGRSSTCSNRPQACRSASCCSVSVPTVRPQPTSTLPVRISRLPVHGTNSAAPAQLDAGLTGSS
jgi:Glyoxalase-like domain